MGFILFAFLEKYSTPPTTISNSSFRADRRSVASLEFDDAIKPSSTKIPRIRKSLDVLRKNRHGSFLLCWRPNLSKTSVSFFLFQHHGLCFKPYRLFNKSQTRPVPLSNPSG